ncbi:hypothetical protein [Deinococcus peraridilitoris]|uniref:Uncharacterized protein n=1 Tax=Deinococcus peraridilitoris (strain DSM 19664 / LMG 22246 / CIP 109416 / KR-200) TaxID=937777 RepID=K9ZYE4_DEIPD|nr:hypothetical protein [Deinococcus peraridilitoris]AFZ65962.1 hypothetical protein Deipe_0362 [Deinococcus peraridilitoris DSM 19664]
MTELTYPLLVSTVAVVMLVWWAVRTVRLRRSSLVNRRGFLVPLGIALLWSGLLADNVALIGSGFALALIGEYWPDLKVRRTRKTTEIVHAFPRWQRAQEPQRPDIELHLEETGARVKNIGPGTLFLHGWSPADQNGWLMLRADDGSGTPIKALPSGQWARLSPWTIPNRGVRVWYTRSEEAQPYLFRADWQDVTMGSKARVLN